MKITATIITICLLLTLPFEARCDSDPQSSVKASDASFDKRLPPVLPGEEIGQGSKKMKVWSTAGEVPVNTRVPQAPAAAQASDPWQISELPPIGGVIVDQRRDRSQHK